VPAFAAGLAADGWDLGLSFWRPYDKRHGWSASRTTLIGC
jgi:hypothetical protein